MSAWTWDTQEAAAAWMVVPTGDAGLGLQVGLHLQTLIILLALVVCRAVRKLHCQLLPMLCLSKVLLEDQCCSNLLLLPRLLLSQALLLRCLLLGVLLLAVVAWNQSGLQTTSIIALLDAGQQHLQAALRLYCACCTSQHFALPAVIPHVLH